MLLTVSVKEAFAITALRGFAGLGVNAAKPRRRSPKARCQTDLSREPALTGFRDGMSMARQG